MDERDAVAAAAMCDGLQLSNERIDPKEVQRFRLPRQVVCFCRPGIESAASCCHSLLLSQRKRSLHIKPVEKGESGQKN
jgi:hypothetical protein